MGNCTIFSLMITCYGSYCDVHSAGYMPYSELPRDLATFCVLAMMLHLRDTPHINTTHNIVSATHRAKPSHALALILTLTRNPPNADLSTPTNLSQTQQHAHAHSAYGLRDSKTS